MPIARCQYNGELLTDITQFTIVQTLFNNPNNANMAHLANLDTLIENILFHDKIFIIGTTKFGKDFEIRIPHILNDMIDKKVVEIYPPNFCDGETEFISLYEEISQNICPDTLETFYSRNKDIERELKIYDSYFKYGKQKGTIELAKLVGVSREHDISLLAHLVRTNVHFKCLHEIEKKINGRISYTPHTARVPLVKEICDRYENRVMPIAQIILKEMGDLEKAKVNKLNIYGSMLEFDMPYLTTMVLSQCTNKVDLFDELLSIRNDGKVRKFKKWCNKFQEAVFNNDRDTMEKCYNQLESLQARKSVKEILRTVPKIDLSLTMGGITLEPLAPLMGSLSYLIDYWNTKDLIYLSDLKNKSKNIGCSKSEYEKFFRTKFKI